MSERDAPVNPRFMKRRYLPLLTVAVFATLSTITFYICYQHHAIHTEQPVTVTLSVYTTLPLRTFVSKPSVVYSLAEILFCRVMGSMQIGKIPYGQPHSGIRTDN